MDGPGARRLGTDDSWDIVGHSGISIITGGRGGAYGPFGYRWIIFFPLEAYVIRSRTMKNGRWTKEGSGEWRDVDRWCHHSRMDFSLLQVAMQRLSHRRGQSDREREQSVTRSTKGTGAFFVHLVRVPAPNPYLSVSCLARQYMVAL